MAPSLNRTLQLLAAAEDLDQGLGRLIEEIQDSWARTQAGTTDPQSALDQLAILANKNFLLRDAATAVATVRASREFYSAERLSKNRRSKASMARKRARSAVDQYENSEE